MPLTFNPASVRIGIVGPGYVGLPRAVEFARKYHNAFPDRRFKP